MKMMLRLCLGGCLGLLPGGLAVATAPAVQSIPADLTAYVAPVFPAMLREDGVFKGNVLVAVAWDRAGVPRDVVVLETTEPRFAPAAVEAARQWRRGADRPGLEVYELAFDTSGVVVSYSGKNAAALVAEGKTVRRPRVLTRDELDAPPQALRQPMPTFPAAAQARWTEARVTVDFFVDESGRVRAPAIQSATAEEFAEATLETLREWQFEVPRRHGRPAFYAERWTFDFRQSG
jgi:TonB family protein